jgi:hypothetical protein
MGWTPVQPIIPACNIAFAESRFAAPSVHYFLHLAAQIVTCRQFQRYEVHYSGINIVAPMEDCPIAHRDDFIPDEFDAQVRAG